MCDLTIYSSSKFYHHFKKTTLRVDSNSRLKLGGSAPQRAGSLLKQVLIYFLLEVLSGHLNINLIKYMARKLHIHMIRLYFNCT